MMAAPTRRPQGALSTAMTTIVEPFPLIDLAGPPEARGRAYGQAAKARVRRTLAHYGAQLAGAGQDAAAVRAMARAFVPKIEAFDPAYVAEMRGIAAAADVAFEDIVLVNCRTEVLQLARRAAAAAAATRAAPDGCTGARTGPTSSPSSRPAGWRAPA
jgi:isopenicillin-N N-acyltransferase-like protein